MSPRNPEPPEVHFRHLADDRATGRIPVLQQRKQRAVLTETQFKSEDGSYVTFGNLGGQGIMEPHTGVTASMLLIAAME